MDIPRAFLSHSSNDKTLVEAVAEELGSLRCELDAYTFEFILNTKAIRNSLRRASLFVLFLSQNSIQSDFVAEEVRSALENRAAGRLRGVLIIAIDSASYRDLPDWLREINVAQHLKTAKQIARRIDARLTAITLDEGKPKDIYLHRNEQEQELRALLARSRQSTPVALHLVGHHGSGRRTFVRRNLDSLAPRYYEFPLEVVLTEYDGVIELYRKLYQLVEADNPLVASERYTEFNRLDDEQKTHLIAKQIRNLADSGCILLFVDEGGVYQGSGDYREHFPLIIRLLEPYGRPIVFFLQTRMMREIYKQKYPKSAHIRIPSMSDDMTRELMALILNELKVDFRDDELSQICMFAGGHPFNIHFIAAYVASEGLDIALSDPTEILEQNYERGLDFLRRIPFSDLQIEIVAVLKEYRFCDLEFMAAALDKSSLELAESVRNLEDHCVVERRDRMLNIAQPLRDGLRRDARFRKSDEWHTEVGRRVVESLAGFETEESVPLSLIDSAIPEMIRQGHTGQLLSNLILPSHFLRLGRSYYDRKRWSDAAEFCRKALEGQSQLTTDAKTEAYRLLGLALARIDPDLDEIGEVVSNLRSYLSQTAKRVAYFIEGFQGRRRGDYDVAESCYRAAAAIEPRNYHIGRELSFVLCQMGRYPEAEPFARIAYRKAPDNPYILDVLIESIEGKSKQGMSVDSRELQTLYSELEAVCKVGKTEFFNIRYAKRIANEGPNSPEAANRLSDTVARAVDEEKIEALCVRALINIKQSAFKLARNDIRELSRLGSEARRRGDVLEVECLIAEGIFEEAKQILDVRFGKSRRVAETLQVKLARAIAFSPAGVGPALRSWAKSVG